MAPAALPVRPTTDFAKEALFSIIGNHYDFKQIEVLDLFAGTGNISYEFASRDVKNVIAVDNNIGCVRFIQQMARVLIYDNLKVIHADYKRFVQKSDMAWDIIFADPPFEMESVEEIPFLIFDRSLLKSGGLFILEHKKAFDFTSHPYFSESRSYGNVNFSFFLGNCIKK